MTQAEYKTTITKLIDHKANVNKDTPAYELLATLDKAEILLFEGKEEIQPVKWHQITRIYKLAVICIDIVRIIWPYIKIIISLIKK